MNDVVSVDVWSDIACPWCFIGKRKFEAGAAVFAASHPDASIDVEYHSFELSPDTPVDFEGSEAEYLSRHKGIPVDQAQQMIDRVSAIAAQVGLRYDYGSLHHTNTVKAHQVIHLAKAQGKQLPMVERLFAAYFEQGRHLGDDAELADLATDIGLDRDAVLQALRDDAFLDAVRAGQAQAQAYGITGVPFFVIDGKYGVSGAQDPETFAQALEQVLALRGAATADPGSDPAAVAPVQPGTGAAS